MTEPQTPLHLDPLDYPAEPDALRAGDSWSWTRIFGEYPSAEGWTLQYILNSPTTRFPFPAGAATPDEDGISFDIAVAGSATAAIPAGEYDLYAVLTNGAQQQTFPIQRVRIDPNMATAAGAVDTRSFVKKTLDILEAAILGDTSANVQEYTIHGRMVKYADRWQLKALRDEYRSEYRKEQIASGEYVPKRRVEIVFRQGF